MLVTICSWALRCYHGCVPGLRGVELLHLGMLREERVPGMLGGPKEAGILEHAEFYLNNVATPPLRAVQ